MWGRGLFGDGGCGFFWFTYLSVSYYEGEYLLNMLKYPPGPLQIYILGLGLGLRLWLDLGQG